MQKQAQIAILVGTKGRGSNMRAIAEAFAGDDSAVKVKVVIAPSEEAPALATAKELGLHTAVIPFDEAFGEEVMKVCRGCDLICLAGFLRLLPSEVLEAFPDRILNTHPALLPKYGGKGMYGQRVHLAVLDAREKESGCTIHLVDEHYDEGEIVLQLRCPVLPDDTPESLAARVLELEHKAYPAAILEMIIRHGA